MSEPVEVKSERMQHVVGEMPVYLVRYGVFVVLFVIGILLAVGCLVCYPLTLSVRGRVAGERTITLYLSERGAARDFHADMPVELVFDGMSVGQTIIKGIGDVQVGADGAFTLDVEVAHLPDTVRTGPFTCVFATGTPITVKTESDAHTILYYVIKNGLK